jgi:threonine dehydrogenase-like Zn-dependent dehydrogenase
MARDAGAIAAASAYSAVEHGTFDLVVDAAGFASTWRVGVEALRPGGGLVVVGLGQPEGIFPMASVVRRAIHVRGHFAYTREDFATALRILEDRSMRFGWVDELPLSDGALAFENLARRPSEFTKVLLRP